MWPLGHSLPMPDRDRRLGDRTACLKAIVNTQRGLIICLRYHLLHWDAKMCSATEKSMDCVTAQFTLSAIHPATLPLSPLLQPADICRSIKGP